MSYNFSLDRKRIVLVSTISIALAVLIFMAGWMAGIMANISRIPSQEIRPSVQRGAAVSKPAMTPATTPQKSIADKRKTATDQVTQKPEAAASSQEVSEIKAAAPKVRMPIGVRPQPQKMPSVPEKAAEKSEGVLTEKKAFSVQAGAFLEKENADDMVSDLREKGYQPHIFEALDHKNQKVFTVRIADYEELEEASQAAALFTEKEHIPAVVKDIHSLSSATPRDVQRDTQSEEAKKSEPSEASKELQPAQKPLAQSKAFTVQVASYIAMQNAVRTANDLTVKGYEVLILKKQDPRGKTWYAVQIGEYKDRGEASRAASWFTAKEKMVAVVMTIAPYLLKERKGPDSFANPDDKQSGGAGEEGHSGRVPSDAQSEVKTE
jgi:cell division septation protein DedD